MPSDQGIALNLSKSPEPTAKASKSPAEGNEKHRFGLLLRRRWRSSARIRRVGSTAAEAEERWRSRRAQRVYSLKLYNALRRSRRSSSSAGERVRDTADRVLASEAGGRTRWSRAILVGQKPAAAARGAVGRHVRRRETVEEGNRVRVLGRLVPGCRRAELPELLNETADYIAALEMQIRAMTALAEILADCQPSYRLGSASVSR